MESPSGSVKDAWPELLHKSGDEAVNAINRSITNASTRVYLQKPADRYQTPPFNPGRESDVWVYTDHQNQVYEVPRRGTWHFNRVSPGWLGLEGAGWQEAVRQISADMIGAHIVYGPEGFKSEENETHHLIRVEIGADGKVTGVPKVQ